MREGLNSRAPRTRPQAMLGEGEGVAPPGSGGRRIFLRIQRQRN